MPVAMGGPLYSHRGKESDAEDQKRVQNNIGHTAAHHTDHGYGHLSHGLEDLFK